ncbi:MAG: caspase family protein [Bryobacteraceae bacterium]|jgi:hypothetical protein
MGDLDWSLSVGVRFYPDPEFGNLGGPDVDADGFHQWVTSPSGGGITDTDRARLVVSKQYNPPFSSPRRAKPTAEIINDFFTELDDISKENVKKGDGFGVGRRLYLYFSGHGYMPVATKHEIGLLMANATPSRLGNHVLGRAWADLLSGAGYFREVLLFMDCCRNEFTNAPLNVPFLNPGNDPRAAKKARLFYAYATKAKGLARERKAPDGEIHGVFTSTLLAGLWGGAADPDTKEIRGSSLKAFLYQNMRQFLAPEDLNNSDIPKEPDVWPALSPEEDFSICTAVPMKFPVCVTFPDSYAGRRINIRCNNKVKETTIADGTFWDAPLCCGVYSAEIVDGPEVAFEVKHPGFAPPEKPLDVRLG